MSTHAVIPHENHINGFFLTHTVPSSEIINFDIHLPNEAFGEPKSDKMEIKRKKRWGYPDYYCKGLFYSYVSLWFHFYCFVDSVVLFTSSETSSGLPALFV